ncbi:MAG TPA: hypothetical protein VGJ14_03290 [Sporichthyaceae bacterium]
MPGQFPDHGIPGEVEACLDVAADEPTLVNNYRARPAAGSGLDVVHLDGAVLNLATTLLSTVLVKWTRKDVQGRAVKGSLRHICHLSRLNELATTKYGHGIEIIQPAFNTGVAASVGTHDFDMCVDLHIPGEGWWDQQRFFRANGLGCWYRHPPAFGNHIHGFTLPPREGRDVNDDFKTAGFKVGKYVDGGWSTQGKKTTSSQIGDYYHHAFGLAGKHTPNSDTSWFPRDIPATIFDLDAYLTAHLKAIV